ncbi:MAG: ANTAR domain-containing protein [Clostridiaceae bacterium]|jgi:AmiR/NasT family two-component response regulator|nr:ANTAR domain-containing protein [Clostridiaceae bacterium]
MDSALIISFSKKSIEYLTEILEEASVTNITAISTACEARCILKEKEYDLCIINAPLPDEFGDCLAREITEKQTSEVILIVKSELFEEVSDRVEEFGVITIAKPIGKHFFKNALKLAFAIHKRIKAIKCENGKLIQKIEDIRIVDRAKCILISHLSITEPEAHRYIEKQAMDMRQTRRKVAEEILRIYEN